MHPVFEALGYAVAYAVYTGLRAQQGDLLDEQQRWHVIAAAAVGALLGSRILGLLEQSPRPDFHWSWHMLLAPGGKTIVGGLLGGWMAVELTKRLSGIRSRTGDLFSVPLCLGIAIGRVGCFYAGLDDDTYGKPTQLPWAVDLGDGIPRHPTQLYEIAFLLLVAVALHRWAKRPHRNGILFRAFMAAYLTWRLLIDFVKPQPLVHGMNLIQWACVAGLVALLIAAVRDGTAKKYQKQLYA